MRVRTHATPAARRAWMIAAAAVAMCGVVPSALAQKRAFSFAYDQPPTTAYGIAANIFDAKLKELSAGNFSINHELTAYEDEFLLAAYDGEVRADRLARLTLMRIVSDFREAMWGVLQQGISRLDIDFVEYTSAKFDRLLANAATPILSVIGLQLGSLLAGSVITETIFAWPGIGRLCVEAIQTRDYPVVQGCVLAIALSYVVVNFATDLVYAWANPRIRLHA